MKLTSSILVTGLAAVAAAKPLLHPHVSNSLSSRQVARSTEESHQTGGEEFVIILDNDQPTPPVIHDVLARLALTSDHNDVKYVFNNTAFRGFVANMEDHCLDALLNMTDVSIVEKAMSVSTFATQRGGAPWGLERISSADTVTGNPTGLDFTYSFDNTELGAGVDIYVIDTGVYTDHIAFGGRARSGFSFENDTSDGDGHGTHVAGTAAGNVLGVASGANIWAVKVLGADGSGSTSDTLKGMDWVIQNHNKRKEEEGFVGSIMSMSWGLARHNDGIDRAIRSASEIGIHMAVAAGNEAGNSCTASPGSSGGSQGPAIVVGSIDITNTISKFSNTGACNDIYAPGEDIVSSWIGQNNYVNSLDGTSMACPHVTGLMAYLMDAKPELRTDPLAMKEYLKQTSLRDVVQGTALDGDDKLLANNGVTAQAKRDVPSNVQLVKKRSVEDTVVSQVESKTELEGRAGTITLELAQSNKRLRL
ncbi:subtilisin-like protein [Eremomyces bilateralis CBS 781.70]|uniref:Subtilisin-like protein n=1 Tax=Eremomyces bilateralis CBS 781.70 TaxID=1392243 RepID=A0A6G1G6E3_9PEZI|nr:subtilisin-like protein [Eremomyces bilateralis CBS 781.70]KAF1813665.1 subtilisin-like protein [Eremomyces bilateralis CBS 781.70]